MKKYTAQYFIDKFSKIPDENWATGHFELGSGKKCALGHCGITNWGSSTKEGDALYHLFTSKLFLFVTNVNDANDQYLSGMCEVSAEELEKLGETPKERVLAALELIQAGVSV